MLKKSGFSNALDITDCGSEIEPIHIKKKDSFTLPHIVSKCQKVVVRSLYYSADMIRILKINL